MLNYKIQNGCHNCKHVFIYEEYDEGLAYYCNIKHDRPKLCGSVYMNEIFTNFREKGWKAKYIKNSKKWNKWAEPHEVQAWGICEEWKKA